MIGTQFYKGQGLGNQLWAYSVVRSLAEEFNFDFGFLGTQNFKGVGFVDLDFGRAIQDKLLRFPKERVPNGFVSYLREELVRHAASGSDISPMDERIRRISDGTFVDGTFQTEKYFSDREKVKAWFDLGLGAEDICVISLRGGEFKGVKDLFLPHSYFLRAIELVRAQDSKVEFEVVTDDEKLAREWFPGFRIQTSGGVKRLHGGIYLHPNRHKIMLDFAKIQSARYLIMSNSSFSWWGAFTNRVSEMVIAPKYWARHNISDGFWSNGDSLTRDWLWLDRNGSLTTYEQCAKELAEYRLFNQNL